jgi:ParB family transcriptional regulator, chromosome partitioning protein
MATVCLYRKFTIRTGNYSRDENVRQTDQRPAIDELAASIQSIGLLQGLVKRGPKGKCAVIASRRRYLALEQQSGQMSTGQPIPCRVIARESDSTEVSLSENVQRGPMHPADEFEAFRTLVEKGQSAADVAARFGVFENVLKRLALARVSPELIARYRAGEMNLEMLQAFTLTDDDEAQERIWGSLSDWNRRPETVREMLSRNAIPASDKRVRLVGLESMFRRAERSSKASSPTRTLGRESSFWTVDSSTILSSKSSR